MSKVYEFKKDDKVVMLSAKDFDEDSGELINKKLNTGYTTIMFYANWCGHCQVAKPVYAKVAKSTCCQTRSAAVDCEKEEDLLQLLKQKGINIPGYPTFLQFKDGKFYREYKGSGSDGLALMNFIVPKKHK